MIGLRKTTLVSGVFTMDREFTDRTARVLEYCMSLFTFRSLILFSVLDPPVWYSGNKIQAPILEKKNIGLLMPVIYRILDESRVMFVHEDGFILRPELWDDEFLDYDYIGAPWQDGVVGNNGFCMMSKKFMKATRDLPFQNPEDVRNEDEWFCRIHREKLEKKLQFAPMEMARRFSSECVGHDEPSFGFHGRTHNPNAYEQGWKMIKDRFVL